MTGDDPQAESLYQMERDFLNGHTLHVVPLAVLQRAARYVCREWGLPSVSVKSKTFRDYHAVCDMDDRIISIHPKTGCNALTLAHELAHYLVYCTAPRAQFHGPLWLAVYCYVAAQFGLGSVGAFRLTARERGLSLAPSNAVEALRVRSRTTRNRPRA